MSEAAVSTSFLGREAELEEGRRFLRETRLLTVTGPGGAGKTRFALELARGAAPAYRDGVVTCHFASLRDQALVLPTVAQALGIREEPERTALDSIAAHTEGSETLVVLDNLEHLPASRVAVADLVERCPGLTLLCTSRDRLRLDAERAYALPPLRENDAVDLFCERARVEPSNTIRTLCARLDGLPLAIELAAARLELLTAEQLLARLSRRLDLLKGPRDADPRQQTLRATIQWSHDLLVAEERTLFARLSVFAGGCTLEAAEEVCGARPDTLDSLVDKSLLYRDEGRYAILETIRDFAAERLVESGEDTVLREGHAGCVLEHARRVATEAHQLDQSDWLARCDAELANVLTALSWARDCGLHELELEIAASLAPFFMSRGRFSALAPIFDRTIPKVSDSALLERALFGASWFSFALGDDTKAAAYAGQRLAIARRSGDTKAALGALDLQATIAAKLGDHERARSLYLERLELARGSGDPHRYAHALTSYANFLIDRSELDEAISKLARARPLAAGETPMFRAWVAGSSGRALRKNGQTRPARSLLVEAVGLIRDIGGEGQVAWIAGELAFCLADAGDDERAALLLGSAEAAGERLEVDPAEIHTDERTRTLAALKARLGEARFQEAYRTGRGSTLVGAIEQAGVL